MEIKGKEVLTQNSERGYINNINGDKYGIYLYHNKSVILLYREEFEVLL